MFSINISIIRASMLITESMTSFDPITNLTKPRIATTYEAMLFTKNGGYFVVDGIKHDIKKGTVRFIKPGQEIYSKKYKDAYVIYFNATESEFELIDKIPTRHLSNDYSENLNLFQSIVKIFKYSNEFCYKNYLACCFLLKLIQNFYEDSNATDTKLDTGDSAVFVATDYIEHNYTKQISLSDIANAVNLHPNYFHKLFKSKVGKTPFDYLNDTRINAASDVLISTTHSISNVAYKCGFDSSSYFIYVFKKKKGITPKNYRLLHSKDLLP